jgi:hypothetical protein
MRNALRDFALSRIRYIEPVSKKISLLNSMPSVKEYLRKNFGLISGNNSIEISLKFTPEISKWISEQIWHSGHYKQRWQSISEISCNQFHGDKKGR